MTSTKTEFDASLEKLLEKLNSLTGEILNKALGENPQKRERDKFYSYWLELQLEIAEKIGNLTKFQNKLNSRCNMIQVKVKYADLSGPSPSQGPPGSPPQARTHRFAPNGHFLSTDRQKPWFTTTSDTLTDNEIGEISEWLKSGGVSPNAQDPKSPLSLCQSWYLRR